MRISEQVRERVLQAAHLLDYRPNLMARALRTKITHTIAFISDTIATEPYAGQVVYGGLAAAANHGYVLLLGETDGDPEIESRLVENFLDRQVDGFIYAAMYTRDAVVPPELRDHRLVLLNCSTDEFPAPTVLPDEINAGRTAARTLLDAGHRDAIHLVGNPAPGIFAGRERREGLDRELADAGTGLAGVIICGWDPESAFDEVTAFLGSGERATAFVCLNDRIALGTYQALEVAGLAVPIDVSVVSFDDSDLAGWLRPGLTSVALPHYEMGRTAVELLLSVDRSTQVRRIEMPLRVRESVGSPAT